jgi:hypothetical protein
MLVAGDTSMNLCSHKIRQEMKNLWLYKENNKIWN